MVDNLRVDFSTPLVPPMVTNHHPTFTWALSTSLFTKILIKEEIRYCSVADEGDLCLGVYFTLLLGSSRSNGADILYTARMDAVSAEEQRFTLPEDAPPLTDATRYSYEIRLVVAHHHDSSYNASSARGDFFTGIFSSSSWPGVPIWAPPGCASNSQLPQFVHLEQRISIPVDTLETLTSALVFVTAETPWWQTGASLTDAGKLLASYRLKVNGEHVGIGPGRSTCPRGTDAYYGCEGETVYDGYDISDLLVHDDDGWIDFHIAAYGLEQPQLVGITPKVLLAGFLHFENGTVERFGTDANWAAFSADGFYNPSGNSGAGIWYVAYRKSCISFVP